MSFDSEEAKTTEGYRVCGQCLFGVPREGGTFIECRRYPPPDEFGGPVVPKWHWCGEWRVQKQERIGNECEAPEIRT